jgi:hypothetical protein
MKKKKQKTKGTQANLQHMAEGFRSYAKSIAKQLNIFAYCQNGSEVTRLYLFYRPVIENWGKLTKENFPNSLKLPDLPTLIENSYYAGLTRLEEYCEKAAQKLIANPDLASQRPTEASGEAGDEEKQTSEINKVKGGLLMVTTDASKKNWEKIKSEYDCSKKELAKKINFVKDAFKRKIIFRDVEQAFVLASHGFAKPAVILAGGVIEELLKEFLKHKNIKPKIDTFSEYIKACENNRVLERGVSRLSDAIRDFRNLVHISREESKRYTLSKATAIGAVSSIFTIANDFH